MKEQRRARKIAGVGQAHWMCTMPPWKLRHGNVNPPSPMEGCGLETNSPRFLLSCWPRPVSCCFPVLPCPRRIHTGQNAGRRLFAWGLTLRWVDDQRGLSTAAALKWKSKAEGVWQRSQASTANDFLRLPSLMLNKSFRIQGFKKKTSEDSKSAPLFLWNWTGEEFQLLHLSSPLVISNWGYILMMSSLNILVLMDPFSLSQPHIPKALCCLKRNWHYDKGNTWSYRWKQTDW